MAVCTALFTAAFREPIALLYNDSPAVVAMASQLMLLAALYQIRILSSDRQRRAAWL